MKRMLLAAVAALALSGLSSVAFAGDDLELLGNNWNDGCGCNLGINQDVINTGLHTNVTVGNGTGDVDVFNALGVVGGASKATVKVDGSTSTVDVNVVNQAGAVSAANIGSYVGGDQSPD